MTITIISKLSFLNSLEDRVIFINKNYLTTVPNNHSKIISLPQKATGSETYSLSCNRLGLPAIKVEDGDTIFIVNNPYYRIAITVVLLCLLSVIYLSFSSIQIPSFYQQYAQFFNFLLILIVNVIPRYRLVKDDPDRKSVV